MTFVDRNSSGDPGFTLTLSQRMNYNQIARAVGEKLDTDPFKIQFFKSQSYREGPGHALRCTFEGTLKDLLVYFRPKQPKRIFYQLLSIPIQVGGVEATPFTSASNGKSYSLHRNWKTSVRSSALGCHPITKTRPSSRFTHPRTEPWPTYCKRLARPSLSAVRKRKSVCWT